MATVSKNDVSTTAGIAAAFNSMQDSLDKIEKNTAVMGTFAKTAESLAEAGRAQKLRDNEQTKQTGFLAGLFKRSKEEKAEKDKDKGFFAKHWLKLLLAGLAIFALLKAPISLFADVKDFIEKNMTEILVSLGLIAAGIMAGLAWMGKEALAVYKGLKSLRDIGKSAGSEKTKQRKTPKSESKFKNRGTTKTAKNMDDIAKQTKRLTDAGKETKPKPSSLQKAIKTTKNFWNNITERNLAKRTAESIHLNPNAPDLKTVDDVAKKVKTTNFAGTNPLITDEMKRNINAAQDTQWKGRKLPKGTPGAVPVHQKPFTKVTPGKGPVTGSGGIDLDPENLKKSKAFKTQVAKESFIDKALKNAEIKTKKVTTKIKPAVDILKKVGKGTATSLRIGGMLIAPLVYLDNLTEQLTGNRTNFLGFAFGETKFYDKDVRPKKKFFGEDGAAAVAGDETAAFFTIAPEIAELSEKLGYEGFGRQETTKETRDGVEMTKFGGQYRPHTSAEGEHFTKFRKKKWKEFGDWLKFKTEKIKKSVAATIAMNPETADLLHISGATMSGMGQTMNVTSAFRTRKQQVDAMEWQRKNKPEDYKANYSLGGTITPSADSTEQWLSKTSSRHQHGKGFDISWPPGHSKNNTKGKALISALNSAYRANGVKAFAVPEGNHVHIGSGVAGVSLGMAGPEVEKLYGETLQRLESGAPNTSGTVLQNLNQFTADPHTQMNKGPVVFQDNSTKSSNTTSLIPGSATDRGGFWHGVMSMYHGTANWKLQGQGY